MVSVHPDKTAIRAVDACGGTYTAEETSSRFAEGHTMALCDAMAAVVDADALTAELLKALQEAHRALLHYEWYANPKSGWAGNNEFVRHMVDAAIAKAVSQ